MRCCAAICSAVEPTEVDRDALAQSDDTSGLCGERGGEESLPAEGSASQPRRLRGVYIASFLRDLPSFKPQTDVSPQCRLELWLWLLPVPWSLVCLSWPNHRWRGNLLVGRIIDRSVDIRAAVERQGPVNLPPEAAGLRQAMRKTHSYMWLEDAVADENAAQDARARRQLPNTQHNHVMATPTIPSPTAMNHWVNLVRDHWVVVTHRNDEQGLGFNFPPTRVTKRSQEYFYTRVCAIVFVWQEHR